MTQIARSSANGSRMPQIAGKKPVAAARFADVLSSSPGPECADLAIWRFAQNLDGSGDKPQSVTFTISSERCGLLTVTVTLHHMQCNVVIITDGSPQATDLQELHEGITKRLSDAGYAATVRIE